MFGFFEPQFNPAKDIPDLSGKVILVTGGNVGLGLASVIELARHNPKRIFLAARNEEKARKAMESISWELGTEKASVVSFLPLDLSSFDSIRKATEEVKSQTDELHILLNNAGIMMTPATTTKDGYEEQFGTNHMGHALLTRLLLPLLEKTAQGGKVDVRVVNLSSAGEGMAAKDGFSDLPRYKTPMEDVSTYTRYGASKLANIYHAQMLARKYPHIKAVAVHPGVVNTNLLEGTKKSYPWLVPIFMPFTGLLFKSPAEGAKNQLWAATNEKVISGEFYWPVGLLDKGSALSKNPKEAEKLWEWTEKELDAYLKQ
ncbi:uncharacterized protein PpBr36_06132 [Pyricularia pennisetigena]|uniref:uncharacterized protein n=1 Tax=Pyricularia pennisetigena TaxID=1578925 RepID=UPI00114D5DE7|nr:uncharacterized protein PpBr36_06132 [Pyricularia pennisetigena]TLS23421.1 hypothetical protein PpBr36_06132 [Pyricularia pennisetigena]